MNENTIIDQILEILDNEFHIIKPDLDEDLELQYDFTDIDALELFDYLESKNGWNLANSEWKELAKYRTVNNICNVIMQKLKDR